MGPMNLHFDFRDIFRSPRLALSGKKILIFLKANLLGFAVYWIFAYLALILNGNNFILAINKFGLYPCIYQLDNISIIAQIVYWIGISFWLIDIFFACTAVSRVTYKQLKGDDFYSISDAKKFVKNHRYPIVLGWLSILFIAVFFIIIAFIFALIGKIPYIGDILFALLYIVYFFGSVFTIYTLIVFIISVIYSPAIVATMEEDTMGTVFQSYSATWAQPWRIIVYNLILIPIIFIGVAIFKWFWLAGYKFINLIFGMDWVMGTKLHNIVGLATDIINPNIEICKSSQCSIAETCSFPSVLSLQDGTILSTPEYIGGTIVAIILFVIVMSIISYGLSILSVGETIIFTVLKMKSNNDNLLEFKDEDDISEELNKDSDDEIAEEITDNDEQNTED